jgi:hypothetical protein
MRPWTSSSRGISTALPKSGALDRLHEMHRRDMAATRAVMRIKDNIRAAGVFVPPSSSEGLARAAHRREVEAKAKRPARTRWRDPMRSPR